MADGIGAVDTSSYPRPQPPVNPLDQILKVGQTADVLGNIEVGKGLQQAIQPDGTIDRNILAQVLKGSVAGSMQAPKALTALEHLRNAGYTADTQGLMNFNTRLEHIAKATASLVDLDPKASKEEVRKALMQGFGYLLNPNNKAAEVGLTVPIVADAQKHFYDAKGDPKSASEVIDIAKRFNTQAQTTQEAVRLHLKHNPEFNTGAAAGQAGPVAGSPINPQGYSVAAQPTPAQGTVDTRERLPDGRPNPNYGQPVAIGERPGITPSITRFGPNGQPINPTRQFTEGATVVGREPTVNAATGQPMQTPQAGAANGPISTPRTQAGPIPTGLPPGEPERLKASVENYTKRQEKAADYRTNINPLISAIPLLERVTTGPGTETVNQIQAFAEAMGLKIPTSKQVSDYAEAMKYLNQNATSIAPPGSNVPSVIGAFESNPNMRQPSTAARDLSKVMLTLARLNQAAIFEFSKTGYPPSYFNTWAAKEWSLSQDPRAYGADLMSKEQRAKLEKSIKPGTEAARRFRNSLETAAKIPGLLGDVEGHPFGGGG